MFAVFNWPSVSVSASAISSVFHLHLRFHCGVFTELGFLVWKFVRNQWEVVMIYSNLDEAVMPEM